MVGSPFGGFDLPVLIHPTSLPLTLALSPNGRGRNLVYSPARTEMAF